MKYIKNKDGVVVKLWVGNEELGDNIVNQLTDLSKMPFMFKNGIACMPDVHYGKGGAAVGSVIPTVNAVIPATVGVDIGCGMSAVKTSLKASDLPESLFNLRMKIEAKIPTGINVLKNQDDIEVNWDGKDLFRQKMYDFAKLIPKMTGRVGRIENSLGTLGGGNHFVEICLDENQDVWVMLHSGSRSLGAIIGNRFINEAKEQMERYFINLPNKDLSYLVKGTKEFNVYIQGVNLAQQFAKLNREAMMKHVIESLVEEINVPFTYNLEAVDCHHNYVSFEEHYSQKLIITRKGAINAEQGKLGIIPGSMGAKSYIVRGKGNNESYNSCSHGAGRLMSRNEARKKFTIDDLIEQTKGVESRKDNAIVDEIPGAYKDIDQVMANQKDLVDVVHTLKAVLCIKGA